MSKDLKECYTSKFYNYHDNNVLLVDLPIRYWEMGEEIASTLLGNSFNLILDIDIIKEMKAEAEYTEKRIFLLTQLEHAKIQHLNLYQLLMKEIKEKEHKYGIIKYELKKPYTIGMVSININDNLTEEIIRTIAKTMSTGKGVKEIEEVESEKRIIFTFDQSNIIKSLTNFYNIDEWFIFIEINKF